MDWGFQRLDGDIFIPRQYVYKNQKLYPALITQFCPQKMTSHVKFPLCFTNIFTINVGNPFEGYIVRGVIYFSLALPFSLYFLQCAKCTSEPAEVDFSGRAGREEA